MPHSLLVCGALLLVMLISPRPVPATESPSSVDYQVDFPEAVHHEARIHVTFRDVPTGPLQVRMSRSSPGRYRLHEFARNVYSVAATNGAGKSLAVDRPDPHQWDITGHDGTVHFTYTLFGDLVSGTYSAIDSTHAHLNAPATFVWARQLTDRPVRVTLNPPNPDWHIATQLFPTDDPHVFTAPNMQYLMDSPIEVSDFTLRTWTVGQGTDQQHFELALHHEGTDAEADAYALLAARVVREQAAIMGELPRFDADRYTFIANYLPHAYGDAMEHRNSTTLNSRSSLADATIALLGTLSHEFFHVWNVERLRPKSLEPFDFERANMSGELWFAEGFTNYYDDLTLRRAHIIGIDRYAEDLSTVVNAVMNTPATRYGSPVEMSRRAPLVDRAVWVDRQNLSNIYLTYYTYGDAVALALDLMLRTRTRVTLDDYLRALWDRFGRDEIPYTNDDLQTTLAAVTDDPDFAAQFFARYVHGREVAPYGELLAAAGLVLRTANPDAASVGTARLVATDEGIRVDTMPRVDSPLYEAGLTRGDVIHTVDGINVDAPTDFTDLVENHRPGDALSLGYHQRGSDRTTTVTLAADPTLEVVPIEHTSEPLTAAAQSFRDLWLESSVEHGDDQLNRRCPKCNRWQPLESEFCPHDGKRLVIELRRSASDSEESAAAQRD